MLVSSMSSVSPVNSWNGFSWIILLSALTGERTVAVFAGVSHDSLSSSSVRCTYSRSRLKRVDTEFFRGTEERL